ncbi:metallophosphoesterase [Desulfuromonas sp. TF]|uniref:metallophosphoesterase n=1 Tax=Desulfuromonas sp. TF TaxID=1232410 RepID=UPI000408386E|nr:metallophosphoesterase [Desulfuromonas sp. TF]
MLIFALTFLAIYSAMHALVFWGFYPLLSGHPALPTLTGLWMGAMIVAPVACRVLDHHGHPLFARALAWVGYSWMGLLFLAFSLFALLGVWELLIWSLARFYLAIHAVSLYGAVTSLLVLVTVLAAGLYGLFEASARRVERVTLESAKLPANVEKLRIVQISDLHLGLIHREEALAPIAALISELEPDLLVATGDVVDAQISHLDGLSTLWRRLDPPLGKYAVIGNHEVYAGLEQSLAFLERSGFTVLRNEGATLRDTLALVGVDDPAARSPQDETFLLKNVPGNLFTVLLKHRPVLEEESQSLFDLQLSGHAHRGQIFPFNFLTGLEYPMQNGLYSLSGGSHLYTSRGTGTWGPPMRILAPPEITVFEIVRKPEKPTDRRERTR